MTAKSLAEAAVKSDGYAEPKLNDQLILSYRVMRNSIRRTRPLFLRPHIRVSPALKITTNIGLLRHREPRPLHKFVLPPPGLQRHPQNREPPAPDSIEMPLSPVEQHRGSGKPPGEPHRAQPLAEQHPENREYRPLSAVGAAKSVEE